MDLQRYHDRNGYHSEFRTALVVSQGRKWMQLLIVRDGRLHLIRRLITEQRYMNPISCNERRVKATIRRLARKKGTARKVRSAVSLVL